MAQKTRETEANVTKFIDSFVNNEQKKADSFKIIELMTEGLGFEPKMWGPSIVGFAVIIANTPAAVWAMPLHRFFAQEGILFPVCLFTCAGAKAPSREFGQI